NNNPYKLGWVNPSLTGTPHSSIPTGIFFNEYFDPSEGRWRYFLNVDGQYLASIGKYVVYFNLEDREPIAVTYKNGSELGGVSTYRNKRYLRATLTVAYGIDQCI